ncbi:serine/threonine protein kinase [Geodermatophilus obscurus]|uniref:non-specific serine/threonine protein kinase n=1 Tax=Geodermatophilus obscurus TaxID=1861 RepID=A0A1I5I9I5_9ACTN|nr:serine/threonine-protein kinase [Geodermatophilus obscurus]SFO56796.1 serine/threonine protein kinase [Geodermatophilus obscurus]
MTDGARRRVVGGRYVLEGLIAVGGMGQVWRGRDTLLDRPVAVKLLRAEYGSDETVRARFRTEAHLAGRLAHRNIAALYDYGEQAGDDGAVCAHLVMELVDGEPLAALLARDGTLPADRVLDLVGQTAQGLAVAHAAGVVHRDVKPGNLLVGRDGVVRITDFGIAWSAASAPLTRTDQVVGTAHYLSPEQAGAGRAGPASDVYALGMVAWECLAGRRAFDGGNPVQIALRQLHEEPPPLPGSVPAPVRELVSRMVAKDPAARPADGAALAEVVAAVRAGRALPPAPLPRTSPLPVGAPAGRPPRRRRTVRALGVAVTLAAGAALGVGALQLAAPGSGTPPSAVADAAPTGVDVRRGNAVGRSADEVEDALVAAGLRVTRGTQESAVAAPGTVLGVTPVGLLAPGELVTLTVAVAPPSPPPTVAPPPAAPSRSPSPAPSRGPSGWPSPVREQVSSAPGRTQAVDAGSVTSEAPPPAPAPAPVEPVASAPPEPAPEPEDDGTGDGGNGNAGGNGNGNAGGNGNGNGRGGRDG